MKAARTQSKQQRKAPVRKAQPKRAIAHRAAPVARRTAPVALSVAAARRSVTSPVAVKSALPFLAASRNIMMAARSTQAFHLASMWTSARRQFSDDVAGAAQRENGTVKWFDAAKGFGFITRESGNDLFVHFTSIIDNNRYRTLTEGQQVEFTVGTTAKGPAAVDVVTAKDSI